MKNIKKQNWKLQQTSLPKIKISVDNAVRHKLKWEETSFILFWGTCEVFQILLKSLESNSYSPTSCQCGISKSGPLAYKTRTSGIWVSSLDLQVFSLWHLVSFKALKC